MLVTRKALCQALDDVWAAMAVPEPSGRHLLAALPLRPQGLCHRVTLRQCESAERLAECFVPGFEKRGCMRFSAVTLKEKDDAERECSKTDVIYEHLQQRFGIYQHVCSGTSQDTSLIMANRGSAGFGRGSEVRLPPCVF